MNLSAHIGRRLTLVAASTALLTSPALADPYHIADNRLIDVMYSGTVNNGGAGFVANFVISTSHAVAYTDDIGEGEILPYNWPGPFGGAHSLNLSTAFGGSNSFLSASLKIFGPAPISVSFTPEGGNHALYFADPHGGGSPSYVGTAAVLTEPNPDSPNEGLQLAVATFPPSSLTAPFQATGLGIVPGAHSGGYYNLPTLNGPIVGNFDDNLTVKIMTGPDAPDIKDRFGRLLPALGGLKYVFEAGAGVIDAAIDEAPNAVIKSRLELLKKLVGLDKFITEQDIDIIDKVVADPPDPQHWSVFDPGNFTLSGSADAALLFADPTAFDASATDLGQLSYDLDGLLVAYERWQGAVQDGSAADAALQLTAYLAFEAKVKSEVGRLGGEIGDLSDAYAGIDFGSQTYSNQLIGALQSTKDTFDGLGAAVPEPHTWLELLIGLCGAGGALRHARQLERRSLQLSPVRTADARRRKPASRAST